MQIDRIWAMPNSETFSIKPIKNLILAELTLGTWLDPFARNSKISTFFTKVITNDLNPDCATDYHMDALEFLKQFDDNSVDGVLFDPPYSPRQVRECYDNVGIEKWNGRTNFWSDPKNEITRIVKPGGKVISFGWNSMGIGKTRGFEIIKILLVPHGGAKNDTMATVEIKKRKE